MAVHAERRVPLSRERVLQEAMRLVDEGGIDALSMRKLGEALGVEAMSLYNHVANKDDIVDSIVDLALSEVELPSAEEEWEATIRKFALSAHETFRRHPWACNLMMSRPRLSPARLGYMEALLQRLAQAGFSPDLVYHAYHTIDSHILGFSLWLQGHSMDESKLQLKSKEMLDAFLRAFPRGEYPAIAEHIDQHMSEGSHKDEGTFAFGLRLILDGLKREYEG